MVLLVVIECSVTTVTFIVMEVLLRVAPTVTTVSMVVTSVAPMLTVNVTVVTEAEAIIVLEPVATTVIPVRTVMEIHHPGLVARVTSVRAVGLV